MAVSTHWPTAEKTSTNLIAFRVQTYGGEPVDTISVKSVTAAK